MVESVVHPFIGPKLEELKSSGRTLWQTGEVNPRYVGPFKVLERVRDVAYKLDLPKELSRVHNTFHVSNLKKCHANEPLAVSLDGLHFDDKLHFVEEQVEIRNLVVAGTNSTNFSGTKEAAGQDVKKYVSFLRYIILPNWFHEAHLESFISNAQDTCSADAPKISGNFNPTATSTNPPADHMETLAVENPIPTVSSPVPTACLNDSPELSSDTRLIFKIVTSQDDMPSLDNILTLTNRFEDILEVITNTDDTIGVAADLGNMETTITASPTPTLRIHRDHPKSQIIGPVDTPIQTRNKSKEMEEKGFIATIHQKTNPALYQMDVKSAFLYGTIDEEVYLMHPPRFQDPEFLARVYKVEKAIEFKALMHEKFQMSAMGELNFFLGLQVLQKEDGIFLSQDKYIGDILKKFGYSDLKSSNTPMDKENP
nr:hypothetical protein [Tanacetum cinerariifolium]